LRDAGATADQLHQLATGQQVDESRCRCGVADAHVADDQQIRAGVDLGVGDRSAGVKRGGGFVTGEGVGGGDVAGASADAVAGQVSHGRHASLLPEAAVEVTLADPRVRGQIFP